MRSNPASLGLVKTNLLLVICIRNPVFILPVGTSHSSLLPLLYHTHDLIVYLLSSTFSSCLLQILLLATTSLSVLIMKIALILASAGLAGLSSAAFHTLKLQKIPLSKQLVSLFTSPIDFLHAKTLILSKLKQRNQLVPGRPDVGNYCVNTLTLPSP